MIVVLVTVEDVKDVFEFVVIVCLVLVLEDRADVEAVVLIVIVLGVEDIVGKDVSDTVGVEDFEGQTMVSDPGCITALS